MGTSLHSIPVVEILHDENKQKYLQQHLRAREKARPQRSVASTVPRSRLSGVAESSKDLEQPHWSTPVVHKSQHLAQYRSARDFRPIRLHPCNYNGRARRATVNSTQLRAWPVQAVHSAIQVCLRGRQQYPARPFMLPHPLPRQGDPRGGAWCTGRCLLAPATLISTRYCAVDLFTGRHWHQCHSGAELSSGRALTGTRHTN